jgi:hypothetical protein
VRVICTKCYWTLLSTLLLAVTTVSSAQSVKIVRSDVAVLQTQWQRPLHIPVRCDHDGNVYFRGLEQGNASSPVLRVNPKKDGAITYTLDNEPDLRLSAVQDFSVAPDGDLFELVQGQDAVYVASFSSDGSFKSKTKLDRQFWPAHLTVLAGGSRFLVTGSELPQKGGPPPGAVTAIFDDSGKVVKDLTFKQDPAILKEASKGPPNVDNYLADKAILPLATGDTQAGIDGNLYVMRASTPPVVFVMDASGQLIRRITVELPEAGMEVGTMQVSGSRIAFLFYRSDPSGQVQKRIMTLVDAKSAKVDGSYDLGDGLGGAFACYDGSSYTFLTTEHGKLSIVSAKVE